MTVLFGVLLIILGFLALGATMFTTFATIYFLGWLLIIGGAFQVLRGFFLGSLGRFFGAEIGGILSLFVGLIVVANPTITAVTFTLLIAVLLLAGGTYQIISSAVVRQKNWGWGMAGGLLTLILGLIVLANWPVSGLVVLGLFIGVEFIIIGASMIFAPTHTVAPKEATEMAPRPKQAIYASDVKKQQKGGDK